METILEPTTCQDRIKLPLKYSVPLLLYNLLVVLEGTPPDSKTG